MKVEAINQRSGLHIDGTTLLTEASHVIEELFVRRIFMEVNKEL